MRRLVLSLIIGSFVLLAGCAAAPKAPHVSVDPAQHDFGDIVQSQGPVSATIKVKNTGSDPLIINRLSTSCGCTTAKMDESPLGAGETREMTVTFDPMVHPDQFGKIERVVYLQTSDPENPEIEINITGNVIK